MIAHGLFIMSRKAFNFYSSLDEVIQDLSDKQLALFIRALTDVQFLRVHIDSVSFTDKILSITWKAIKHSTNKQIEGYCNKNQIDYKALFCDVAGAKQAWCGGASQQVQEKGEVQGEVQEKGKGVLQKYNPLINQQSLNEWLDYKKYKSQSAITKTGNFLSKYSFEVQQQIVDTSIMNNYKGLFEPKQSNQQKSFKQQDAETSRNKVDAYLQSGYSLRDVNVQDAEVITYDN